jgi:hypothetical protein
MKPTNRAKTWRVYLKDDNGFVHRGTATYYERSKGGVNVTFRNGDAVFVAAHAIKSLVVDGEKLV